MADKSDWELIKDVNFDALRATGALGMAWITWQAYSPTWFLFGLLAAAFAAGGFICTCRVVINAIRLIIRTTRRARFKAKGTDPKADGMAKMEDLKQRGLTK